MTDDSIQKCRRYVGDLSISPELYKHYGSVIQDVLCGDKVNHKKGLRLDPVYTYVKFA
jgi:hypothetical protein